MDTFYDPLTAWSLYLALAFVGCWCWRAMFSVMTRPGLLRDVLVILGPVILLTPAPQSADVGGMAPAFMVAAFSALNEERDVTAIALQWWLAGLLLGILYALLRMIIRLQRRSVDDVDEAHPDSTPE